MSNAIPPACTHESLGFEAKSGTFYIGCHSCDAKWMAVGPNDQPRYELLTKPHGVCGERRSPFYVGPVKFN